MRIERIRVEHFRGLNEQELVFPTRGVAVVEAPNEAGKSSMLEALRTLLWQKASSKSKAVRAIRPAGQDVATLIEADLRCGPYAFTCRKQFHKATRTELIIHAPAREQLAGDEAHDRLQQILETLDDELLAALWFEQGDQLRKVAMGASTSLGRALDRAAGRAAGEGDEDLDDLLATAEAERERYYTPTGKPKAELLALDAEVEEAARELARATEDLEALQRDIDGAARLEVEVAELRRRRRELLPAIEGHEETLARVEGLRADIDKHAAAAEKADAELAGIRQRAVARASQEAAVTAAAERLARGDSRLMDLRHEVERQRERLAGLAGRRQRLRAEADEARALAKLRARDVDHLEDEARLRELEALRDQTARADEEVRQAEAFLAVCELTPERHDAIERAHEALRRAEAQLEAGAPRAWVEALASVELDIDGETAALAPGESRELSASRERALTFPGVARVILAPGTSSDALRETHQRARAQLEAACREAGVPDREEALEVEARRAAAEARVAGRDARLRELLGELSREGLAEELRRRERRTAGYRAERPAKPALPASLAEARDLAEAAEATERAAHDAAADAHAAHDEVAPAVQALQLELAGLESGRAEVAEQLARDERALAQARREEADEALVARERAAVLAREVAQRRLAEAREELGTLEPERVELFARNARASLVGLENELRAREREQLQVRERLNLQGERGLGEPRERSRARLERAIGERDRIVRRARAARLLYEVLVAERDRAREAYRAPLKRAIDELGRIVYGRDFEVHLDDELAVAERTLEGLTLPWEQLSCGAQEQLALLVALACARLVDDGGAPLILDDGLGYTDPQRLARLGAVLSEAGRHGQIIVLTCFPDRFRGVGDALTLRLRGAAPSHALEPA
jgi:hypothetical protein